MDSFFIEGEGSIPVILHLPHNSTLMPDDWSVSLNSDVLHNEIHILVDHHTDILYHPILEMGGRVFHNRYCRIAFDPERFSDPQQEIMNEVGMGVFYTHTSDGIRFREDDSHEIYQKKLQQYYWPYHNALSFETQNMLKKFGRVLFVDGHSYPKTCFSFERFPSDTRPEIDIGTDPFHTPKEFVEDIYEIFSESYSVAIDQPFRGTLIPNGFCNTDSRLWAMMLEVRRDVYLDRYDEGEISLHHLNIEVFHKKLRHILTCYINNASCV